MLPFALLSAFTTLGCKALTVQKLIHILLLRHSPGADFFGTTMKRLAHGETLLVMTAALSKLLISCHTQS